MQLPNSHRPLTGARIETQLSPSAIVTACIAPSRGRGLKLRTRADVLAFLHRPLTGARIETLVDIYTADRLRSPPHGGAD